MRLALARWRLCAPLGGLAAVVAGCVPEAATTQGREIQQLYTAVTILAILVGVFVAALITISVLRFRRRRDDDSLPEQRRGNTGLEILWTAIPAGIVAVLFAATVIVLTHVDSTSATSFRPVHASTTSTLRVITSSTFISTSLPTCEARPCGLMPIVPHTRPNDIGPFSLSASVLLHSAHR